LEFKNGIGRNDSGYPLVSIAQVGPDPKTALPTHAHSLDPIFKPRNHSPLTEPKRAYLVFLNLVAAVKKEVVSNVYYAAGLGGWPLTEREILVFDSTATGVQLQAAQRLKQPDRAIGAQHRWSGPGFIEMSGGMLAGSNNLANVAADSRHGQPHEIKR
jgi:hypothetical protein